jgi:hypothetical protein
MVEAARSSEMLISYRNATRGHNPEDLELDLLWLFIILETENSFLPF